MLHGPFEYGGGPRETYLYDDFLAFIERGRDIFELGAPPWEHSTQYEKQAACDKT
jgi:hypothetical protein